MMKDKGRSLATDVLLALLLLVLVVAGARAGIQERGRYLCLEAGFADARTAGFEVYCVTLVDGTMRVAEIVDGRIVVVVEGDEVPPLPQTDV
jgi:hypothetical protein